MHIWVSRLLVKERLRWGTLLLLDAGEPGLEMWHVRMYLNGQYRGLYMHLENPNADWLAREPKLDGNGWLELSYRYVNPGRHAHLGVTFDYPEAQVTGLRWLGRGPYRVWKNRIQGTSYGVWQKAYNDTRTGADWVYPEFKGHHAGLYWATLQTRELPITVVSDTEGLFLRVLTPRSGVDPQHTAVEFPEGDISFLHGITAIGTKFNDPQTLGPAGQLNETAGANPTQHMGVYGATLFFAFGAPPAQDRGAR